MNVMVPESSPVTNCKRRSRDDSRLKNDERRVAISLETKQMMTPTFISPLTTSTNEFGLTKEQQKDILPVSSDKIAAKKASCIKENPPTKECKNHNKKDEIAIGKDSWLCAYLEMRRKRERKVRQQQLLPVVDEIQKDETKYIVDMIQAHKTPELRGKLYALQRQLYSYHDAADKVEKLKEENKKLADKVLQLEEEVNKQRLILEKLVIKKIRALKGEIEQLKLDVAQSRSKEDRHKEEMKKMYKEKDCLKKEIETLRLDRSTSEATGTNDDTLQRNTGTISRLRDKLLTSFSARSLAGVSSCSEDGATFHDSTRSFPVSFDANELDTSVNVFRDSQL